MMKAAMMVLGEVYYAKHGNPAMHRARIQRLDDGVLITVSNSVDTVTACIPCEVSGGPVGSVVNVDFEPFARFAKSLSGRVVVGWDGSTVTLQAEGASQSFPTQEGGPLPAPSIVKRRAQSIPLPNPDAFGAALSRALICRAREQGRYALHALAIDPEGVVGTDGIVLRFDLVPLPMLEGQILVDVTAARAMARICKGGGGACLDVCDSQVSLRSGPYTLTSSLERGEYPDWRGVLIPSSGYPVSVTMDTKAFTQALLTPEPNSEGALELTFEPGKVTIRGPAGQAEVSASGDGFGRMRVDFYRSILKRVLKSLPKSKTITIDARDVRTGFRLRTGDATEGFTVCMSCS